MDNLCQSISLLVLPVQGTLDENHILDEKKKRMMKMVTYRQGGQKSLTVLRKTDYRSRNSLVDSMRDFSDGSTECMRGV